MNNVYALLLLAIALGVSGGCKVKSEPAFLSTKGSVVLHRQGKELALGHTHDPIRLKLGDVIHVKHGIAEVVQGKQAEKQAEKQAGEQMQQEKEVGKEVVEQGEQVEQIRFSLGANATMEFKDWESKGKQGFWKILYGRVQASVLTKANELAFPKNVNTPSGVIGIKGTRYRVLVNRRGDIWQATSEGVVEVIGTSGISRKVSQNQLVMLLTEEQTATTPITLTKELSQALSFNSLDSPAFDSYAALSDGLSPELINANLLTRSRLKAAITDARAINPKAPGIVTTDLSTSTLTRKRNFTVNWVLNAVNNISDISINNQKQKFVPASFVRISKKFNLAIGTHKISVRATDSKGNFSEKNYTVFVVPDNKVAPLISVSNLPSSVRIAEQTLKLVVMGQHKLARVSINGKDQTILPLREVEITARIKLKTGKNVLEFKAVDKQGNTSLVKHTVELIPSASIINSSAPWQVAYHQAVAFKDKLWVLGGIIADSVISTQVATDGRTPQPVRYAIGKETQEVWSSPDGISWSKTVAPWPARQKHSAVVFQDKIWLIGGESSEQALLNDVWQSSDGKTWEQVTEKAAFSGRILHQAVAFKDKLWVLGGQSNGNVLNEVWKSSDGKSWQKVTNTPWLARAGHSALAFDGKLWVLGGLNKTEGFLNDVWQSTDGENWLKIAQTAWSKREFLQVTTFRGQMWLSGGLSLNGELADEWVSSDGETWTEVTARAIWGKRAIHQVVAFKNNLWLLGGWQQSGIANDIWGKYP